MSASNDPEPVEEMNRHSEEVSEILILSQDVPSLLKVSVPAYADLIEEYQKDLGDAVNYPLMIELFAKIRDAYQASPAIELEIRAFFDACERILRCGDESARDLVILEVIEPLLEVTDSTVQIEKFLGRTSLETLHNLRRAQTWHEAVMLQTPRPEENLTRAKHRQLSC